MKKIFLKTKKILAIIYFLISVFFLKEANLQPSAHLCSKKKHSDVKKKHVEREGKQENNYLNAVNREKCVKNGVINCKLKLAMRTIEIVIIINKTTNSDEIKSTYLRRKLVLSEIYGDLTIDNFYLIK